LLFVPIKVMVFHIRKTQQHFDTKQSKKIKKNKKHLVPRPDMAKQQPILPIPF